MAAAKAKDIESIIHLPTGCLGPPRESSPNWLFLMKIIRGEYLGCLTQRGICCDNSQETSLGEVGWFSFLLLALEVKKDWCDDI